MVPAWMLWPLIALATLAAVIASQALISGAFSLTMQSVQMGYTPFINIRHTSHEEHGQVYIPQINTLLAVGCIALVLAFRSSDALASAYGIAVTLTMIATHPPALLERAGFEKWSALRAAAVCVPFLGIELAFLAANSTKIVEGGWVPLAIGRIVFVMMTTWKKRTTPAAHELPRDSVATRIRRLYISARPTFGRAGTRSRHGGLSCGTAARHSRTPPA